MTPLDLALKYMDLVFKTGKLDLLRNILAEDLQFTGPFFSFKKAIDYINSLKEDPPKDFKYEMIKTFSDDTFACLVYWFSKPGIRTIMTQVFEIKNEKITKILLVFDKEVFKQ